MIKHIIMWDHLEGISDEEKAKNASMIKEALEALVGVIPGLLELSVHTQLMPSSNADMVLYSVMEGPEFLPVYQDHPAHVKAATEVVRPRVRNRRCADYEFLLG